MRLVAIAFAFALALGSCPGLAAPTTHLGVHPDNIVTLQWGCNVGTPTHILSDGRQVANFAIPRRHTLVITDLEWRAQVIDGSTAQHYLVELQLTGIQGPVTRPYTGLVELSGTRGYMRDHLTAGIVVDASVALDNNALTPSPRLSLFGVQMGSGDIFNCNAVLRGYLIRR
jgi:hypothetical protein